MFVSNIRYFTMFFKAGNSKIAILLLVLLPLCFFFTQGKTALILNAFLLKSDHFKTLNHQSDHKDIFKKQIYSCFEKKMGRLNFFTSSVSFIHYKLENKEGNIEGLGHPKIFKKATLGRRIIISDSRRFQIRPHHFLFCQKESNNMFEIKSSLVLDQASKLNYILFKYSDLSDPVRNI